MTNTLTSALPAFEDRDDADTFRLRVERYGADLRESLGAVYGGQAESLYERVLGIMGAGFAARPRELRLLDEARLLHQDWLQRPEMIGYVTYADRFAGTLAGVGEHLDHLERLGVTYLHLMPLLKPRMGENDGGYAGTPSSTTARYARTSARWTTSSGSPPGCGAEGSASWWTSC